MRVRQKFILVIYGLTVFISSFLYVPYAQFYSGGLKTYAGYHLRSTPFWITEIPGRYLSIDSDLILAQVVALTAMAGAAFLFFKHD